MNDINTKTYDSDKIIQIIPAPTNMFYAFDGGKAQPVTCLALVELSNGDREIRPMGIVNAEYIDDMSDTGAIIFQE